MTNQFKSNQDTTPPELRLYTTAEAAAILNVSLRTLQGWVRDGSLPHIRLGASLITFGWGGVCLALFCKRITNSDISSRLSTDNLSRAIIIFAFRDWT